MAKPKKPSMLTRQRQLRRQQQQVRTASSNNLPPRGGTSGGNGGRLVRNPRGQATSSRVEQVNVSDEGNRPTRRLPSSSTQTQNTPSTSTNATKPTQPRLPAGSPGGALALRANRPGVTAAVAQLGSGLIDEGVKRVVRAIQQERSQRAAESGQRGRYTPGDQQVRFDKPVDKKPAGVVPAAQQRTTVVRSPAPKAAPKPEPKAEAQSYRDERDTKGLSVGRYYTLAEHRAAVQAGKSLKIGSKFDTKSDLGVNPKSSNKELDTSKVTDKSNEYDKKKRKKLN